MNHYYYKYDNHDGCFNHLATSLYDIAREHKTFIIQVEYKMYISDMPWIELSNAQLLVEIHKGTPIFKHADLNEWVRTEL